MVYHLCILKIDGDFRHLTSPSFIKFECGRFFNISVNFEGTKMLKFWDSQDLWFLLGFVLTGILLKLCSHNNAAQNKDDIEVVTWDTVQKV